MALNPQLFGNSTPVPFVDEMFVLRRESVEFEVDKVAEYVPARPYFFVSQFQNDDVECNITFKFL